MSTILRCYNAATTATIQSLLQLHFHHLNEGHSCNVAATTAIITLIIQYGSSLLKKVVHNIATILSYFKNNFGHNKVEKIWIPTNSGTPIPGALKYLVWKFGLGFLF